MLGVAMVGGITFFLYWALHKNLLKEDDRFLTDQIHVLRILLKQDPENKEAFRQEVEWEAGARRFAKVYLRVLEESGEIFIETPGMSEALSPTSFPAPTVAETDPSQGQFVENNGTPFRLMAALGLVGNSTETKILQVGLDWEYEENVLHRYRNQLLTASLVALLLYVLVGHQIARKGIRPIREISETARRIRSTTLHERIQSGRFSRELLDLASTFNEMFDRLEDSFTRLSRFSADLAHELRTPINNLRGEIEVSLSKSRAPEDYRAVLESALDECDRLARIIESLLFLARAENPQSKIHPETLDLAREIRTVRDFYEAAAKEAGISLVVEDSAQGEAFLDRTLFQRALGNLIENSLKFTAEGGRIRLNSQTHANQASVTIEDTGCGISQEDLAKVFDRFFKSDPSRTSSNKGSGLGLSIVKSIIELHHGSIEVQSSLNQGTTITLHFPLRANL